jgi:cysteinyl-tRNA synthetase
VFPHHENEIAQTECLTGKEFSRYWVHNGMMRLAGEDMSKSTGNVFDIDVFLQDHDADVFRMLVLNSHYRNPLTFNEDVIQQATRALERLRSAFRAASPASGKHNEVETELAKHVEQGRKGFRESMDDDFNTPGALGSIFELVRAINQARDSGVSDAALKAAQDALLELTGVLGLRLEEKSSRVGDAAPFIELLIDLRTELRDQKNWDLADSIRQSLADLGILLDDGKEGTTWRAQ